MRNPKTPRFHDEESFGDTGQNRSLGILEKAASSRSANARSPLDLIESATRHFESENVKAAVDDIVMAYETLAQENAQLMTLRNQAFRALSTARGRQEPPHPQALRLRRLTPTIPLGPSAERN